MERQCNARVGESSGLLYRRWLLALAAAARNRSTSLRRASTASPPTPGTTNCASARCVRARRGASITERARKCWIAGQIYNPAPSRGVTRFRREALEAEAEGMESADAKESALPPEARARGPR